MADDRAWIAAAIRRARLAADVTQVQLAERLDVAQRTVSGWECGGGIEAVTLVRVARALKISPRDLLPNR